MSKHLELGKRGERIAHEHLISKGYRILETNWRFKKAEVDIIAKDDHRNILIFIEVKTRTSTVFGTPDAFVTPKKERLICDAANAYITLTNHEWEIRFDIISIIICHNEEKLEHIEDAFFPYDI